MLIETVKGGAEVCRACIRKLKERVGENDRKVDGAVAEILRNVKQNGDAALKEYAEKFDGGFPEPFELTKKDMEKLSASCDPEFVGALERAAKKLAYHPGGWRDLGPAGAGLGKGGPLCARRYGGLSFFCADECHPC